jgi:hypothetical protein
MAHDILADLQIFLKSKVFFVDIGSQIVEIPLSDLFGSEFCIIDVLLGIFLLKSFHFSPCTLTSLSTFSSYSCDHILSLIPKDMRR